MYNDFEAPVAKTCTRETVLATAKKAAKSLIDLKFSKIPLPKNPELSNPLKYGIDEEVAYCTSKTQSEWITTGKYTETIVDTVPQMGIYLIVNRDEIDPVIVDSIRIIKKTS